jgi:hypothetical protein
MPAIVKRCTCDSNFQDKKYGKKLRVFNLAGNEKSSKCTVCNKESK